MKRRIVYPIIIEKINDEDGHYYVATSPNIKGMVTDGDTLDEVAYNAEDAIATALEGEKKIPTPQDPTKWKIKNNQKVVYVSVDLSKYLDKFGKTVRKNITIPEYLADWAKKNKINVSRVASDALRGLEEKHA